MVETNNSTRQVGERIYVGRFGSYEWHWNIVEVKKVTPTGTVEVEFPSGTRSRFNAEGKEVGKDVSKYHRYEIDKIPFADRQAQLVREQRTKDAANAIRNIKINEVRWQWGKESLMEEINRVQAVVDAARAAVEAI